MTKPNEAKEPRIVSRVESVASNWSYTVLYVAALLTVWFLLTLTGVM